jgi:hypothetical protein
MGMVLTGAMMLIGAATFSMYQEKSKTTPKVCTDKLKATVVFSKHNEDSPFEIIDQNGNHYIPVLQSNESILSKTGHASICYTAIEQNKNGLGKIYVNKIDYLPLPDEGK